MMPVLCFEAHKIQNNEIQWMVRSFIAVKASSYKDESYVGVCTSCTKYTGMCTSGRKYKRVTPERRMTQERERERTPERQAWNKECPARNPP